MAKKKTTTLGRADGSSEKGRPGIGGTAELTSWASSIGKLWAQRCRADLHREGRAAAGGWPGTLCEAHVYLEQAGQQDLGQNRFLGLTRDEEMQLAHAIYASARIEWLAHLDLTPRARKQKRAQ